MDVPLQVSTTECNTPIRKVSILVLMDVPLQAHLGHITNIS